jgi:hypothetical protein
MFADEGGAMEYMMKSLGEFCFYFVWRHVRRFFVLIVTVSTLAVIAFALAQFDLDGPNTVAAISVPMLTLLVWIGRQYGYLSFLEGAEAAPRSFVDMRWTGQKRT